MVRHKATWEPGRRGSVGKALAAQAWRPEFNPPEVTALRKASCGSNILTCLLASEKQKQADLSLHWSVCLAKPSNVLPAKPFQLNLAKPYKNKVNHNLEE